MSNDTVNIVNFLCDHFDENIPLYVKHKETGVIYEVDSMFVKNNRQFVVIKKPVEVTNNYIDVNWKRAINKRTVIQKLSVPFCYFSVVFPEVKD